VVWRLDDGNVPVPQVEVGDVAELLVNGGCTLDDVPDTGGAVLLLAVEEEAVLFKGGAVDVVARLEDTGVGLLLKVDEPAVLFEKGGGAVVPLQGELVLDTLWEELLVRFVGTPSVLVDISESGP